MQKYTALFLTIVSVVLLFAFQTRRQTALVTFIPPPGLAIQKASINYQQNGEKVSVNGTKEGQAFLFTCSVNEFAMSELLYLVEEASGASKQLRKVEFVLEPANLTVDMTKGTLNCTGSSFQRDLMEFYSLADKLWEKYFGGQASIQLENPDAREKYEAFLLEKNRIWEGYYTANKHPLVTAFTLDKYVTPYWKNLDKAEGFYNQLPVTIKELPDVMAFGEKLKALAATAIGKKCPEFVLPDTLGNLVRVGQLKGKFVLVDFWAHWCKPCRKENPLLVKLYETYKAKGLQVLSVSFDEEKHRDKWKQAIVLDGLSWTQVIDTLGMSKSPVAQQFNINYIPRNLLLDANGVIVAKDLHEQKLTQKLEELFAN